MPSCPSGGAPSSTSGSPPGWRKLARPSARPTTSSPTTSSRRACTELSSAWPSSPWSAGRPTVSPGAGSGRATNGSTVRRAAISPAPARCCPPTTLAASSWCPCSSPTWAIRASGRRPKSSPPTALSGPAPAATASSKPASGSSSSSCARSTPADGPPKTCARGSTRSSPYSSATGLLSTEAALLTELAYGRGAIDEAEELVALSAHLASTDDVLSQLLWCRVGAKVLARRDRVQEALEMSHEAVQLAERTDALNEQADTWMDRAEVLRMAGAPGQAVSGAVEQALDRYARKGNLVSASRAELVLAQR